MGNRDQLHRPVRPPSASMARTRASVPDPTPTTPGHPDLRRHGVFKTPYLGAQNILTGIQHCCGRFENFPAQQYGLRQADRQKGRWRSHFQHASRTRIAVMSAASPEALANGFLLAVRKRRTPPVLVVQIPLQLCALGRIQKLPPAHNPDSAACAHYRSRIDDRDRVCPGHTISVRCTIRPQQPDRMQNGLRVGHLPQSARR